MFTNNILERYNDTIQEIHASDEHVLWDDLSSGELMNHMLHELNHAVDKNDICGAELADMITDREFVSYYVALQFARQVERS